MTTTTTTSRKSTTPPTPWLMTKDPRATLYRTIIGVSASALVSGGFTFLAYLMGY